MNEHQLMGLRSHTNSSLLSYLAALGTFRVLASQADKSARMHWDSGIPVITTILTEEELVEFFLYEYAPSPIISPWNGGNPLFRDKENITNIMNSEDVRFDLIKEAIILMYKSYLYVIQKYHKSNEDIEDSTGGRLNEMKNELCSILNNGDLLIPTRQLFENIDTIVPYFATKETKIKKELVGEKNKEIKSELIDHLRASLPNEAIYWIDANITITSDKKRHILVESTQSMANRLEAVGWNSHENKPIDTLTALPWVEVVDSQDENNHITSSRTEAHRLSSAFIRDSKHPSDNSKTMVEFLAESFGLEDDKPLSNHQISAQIFKLDPLCLIHGVFFADKKLPGQPKISRAISACIEANNVLPAYSGGVKRDNVRHSIKEGQGGSSEGYGSIPFHRTEYSAESITAKFIIDRVQIKSYRLSDEATELLETLALWEVRKLLSEPMRLRTACDLEIIDELVDQEGNMPMSLENLESKITDLCSSTPELEGVQFPLIVQWTSKRK